MVEFAVNDWREQYKLASRSDWKAPIYFFLRPLLHLQHRRLLAPATLERIKPEMVIGERGLPNISRQKWITQGKSLKNKTVLMQGTGNGWDAYSWAKHGPRKIIGVDLFEFESWPSVAAAARKDYNVEIEFHTAPLDQLSFLEDESVDLCVSGSVIEHVLNLPEVLEETKRILTPTGIMSAFYGPLWFAAGGDHFSGRHSLSSAFNHVLLSEQDFKEFFERERQDVENFQAGGRYIELDLFSKLATHEYLEAYEASGLVVENLILELSSQAMAFKEAYPDRFAELVAKYPDKHPDDFIIKSNFIRLSKA